jgi:O-antigen ligase
MLSEETEKSLGQLLAIGTLFVSCLVWTGGVTDPVNSPKLFVLGSLAFGILGILVKSGFRILWKQSKFFLVTIITFITFLITSTIFSKAPFVQSVYGVYGRNTGVLTYFSLALIALGASLLRSSSSFINIIRSLLVAGVVNIVYCFWVLSFGDPIPWNNTYKHILGLLGNPDFISAFLGIVITVGFGFALTPKIRMKNRTGYSVLILLASFLVYKSHAIQGIFVAMAGLAVVLFFLIRDRFKTVYIHQIYLLGVVIGASFTIAGMLQHGPLSFIYKKSVSLRGAYWKAGLNMGQSHPFSGVGMDAYGDWYRSARPPIALIDTPGPTTLSNVSHNVVIDLFASGGYPLFFSYLALLILGLRAIFQLVKRHKNYDIITVVLSSSWLGYEIQSMVSINQIGLAIWGWVLTGLLIAYERTTTFTNQAAEIKVKRSSKTRYSKSQVISPQLIIGVGIVFGALISVPPLASDAKWFTATQSKDLAIFKSALESSYLNPLNSPRLANAAVILQNSNLLPDAKAVALKGIAFNPDYFESYLVLYSLPNVTDEEKIMAMSNMKRLDPNNPNVLIFK